MNCYEIVRSFLVENLTSRRFESARAIVGVMGLNRCQRRWRKHFSPQRETQNSTSTENTAPDMQKPPPPPQTDRQTDGAEIQEGSPAPLKAAHALKQNDKDKDGWIEEGGATDFTLPA